MYSWVAHFSGGSATKILNFMKEYWHSNNITAPKRYNRRSLERFPKIIENLLSELGFALWIRTYLFVSPNQNLDEYEFCESQNETCGFDVDTLLNAVKELNADILINFIRIFCSLFHIAAQILCLN